MAKPKMLLYWVHGIGQDRAGHRHTSYMIVLRYNSAFIYTATISCPSSVIWKLTVVFLYLKRLRMAAGAIKVPHLEVCPIKVPNPSSRIK